MNVFFLFDEYSDVENDIVARKLANIIMDALRHPHAPRPARESVVGEVVRQFWELAIRTASPSSQNRFISTFDKYTTAVVQQASDRTVGHIRSIEDYFTVRRETIGARPSFALLELDMTLPDEVLEHPVIVDLTTVTIDMLILGNDLCSYNVEQAKGDDGHNILTIVMNEFSIDLHGALSWLDAHHAERAARFLELFKRIPSFGDSIDSQLRIYVDGLGNWVRANDAWSFESYRYFKDQGLHIQGSRKVTLLPRRR